MPVTFDTVNGLIDAQVMDDNFKKLEELLKEGVQREDFNEKFTKYKIRRYAGGKVVSFNYGSNPYSSSAASAQLGTFENNWIAGTKSVKETIHSTTYDNWTDTDSFTSSYHTGAYNDPNDHPFELLGFPGGSLYYDFQEQGIPNLKELYADDGAALSNWPPATYIENRFPKGECWSRWLTIPDAAGSVYVEEPCVAIITATVKGNYFFTPAMRVHGTNTSTYGASKEYSPQAGVLSPDKFQLEVESGTWPTVIPETADFGTWQLADKSGLGTIREGMDQSAMLRLGLFVDTNPIVWEDEFVNGNDYGEGTTFTHGYNPWIGGNPTGGLADTKPDGVSATRSWIKVREITYRVRQRNTYQIVAAVELKGRKKYNFSLKFRPAGFYGYVSGVQVGGGHGVGGQEFVEGYVELEGSPSTMQQYREPSGWSSPYATSNPSWRWGENHAGRSWNKSWLWPGVDSLVTNFVESSAIGVEFFYGCTKSSDLNVAAASKNTEDVG